MKYILAIWAAALASVCAAQSLVPGLPDCAKPCAATLPPQCNLDPKCICSDKDWISGISCCVKNRCSESEQEQTLKAAQGICDIAKVTLPSAASCPESSATSGSSGSPSSTATSSGNSRTSTTTGSSMTGSSTAVAVTGNTSTGSTATAAGGAATTPASGSSGAGTQHMAPGLGAGAALLGLALL